MGEGITVQCASFWNMFRYFLNVLPSGSFGETQAIVAQRLIWKGVPVNSQENRMHFAQTIT